MQRDNVQKGNKCEIMILVKKDFLVENEISIIDGIAKIKRCKSSNIWQLVCGLKKEKILQTKGSTFLLTYVVKGNFLSLQGLL